MSVQYSGDKITFADGSIVGSGWSGFKNRLINSDMRIDQRNAGASVTPANGTTYLVDRFNLTASQSSKFACQQNAGSVTPPAGFKNYLGFTSQSAFSSASGDYFLTEQVIEGFNVSDLGWGTANAQAVTLSFWVRSSLTGTHSGSIRNADFTRSYPFNFTISSANTWEQKTITIAGDTSGTWLTNNSYGVRLDFDLGTGTTYRGTANAWASGSYVGVTGAVSIVGTNGATFYITGVQLEKGSTATSFDYRPYGTELALCQRYFVSYGGTSGYERFAIGLCNSTTGASLTAFPPVPMRTTPSLGYSSVGNLAVYDGGNVYAATVIALDQSTAQVINYQVTVASGLTQYRPAQIVGNNTTSARLTLSAEL